MTIEDLVLRELHRAALEAGRRGVAVPSADLGAVARRTGDRTAAEQALKRLVQAKRVVRVRRDLLVLPDATGLLSIDMVDLVDAVALQPYLITGGRALEHFDLTDQHFFGLAVLVPSAVTPLRYRGQTATFFKTDPTNIWGWEPEARPRYALPERALVDVLNHPRYGVSLTQAVDSLLRAASRDSAFLGQLVFKGGIVLRHAHGHLRFSKDIDATRHAPPGHKLEAGDVTTAIRDASIHNVVQFVPDEPATDSARSLDFDSVHVTGEVFPDSEVQVEVSYREAVVGTPVPVHLGSPFYEPFEVLTVEVEEMAAEKLRALAQRLRETDLADLAVMLNDGTINDDSVARFAETKFELVKQGRANRIDRIERNLGELDYRALARV